ncbi:DUF2628 domain-containing protein [Hansschlegelia quercus]|uniref:DUF2628 domain-containing protein n=2 Tax=Hansschlegelia quercus TaxID=2528245 RepID=A0A4Q9GA55_9HYPH|nr:DUF2628 domain-containing protein [Hansschlegelia quercus]
MRNWTIFEPPGGAERTLDGAARFVTLRDGFSKIAFLVPILWLPFRRCWLALAVYVAVQAILALIVSALGLSQGVALVLSALPNVAVGLEASWLRSRALEKRGYRSVATVLARSAEEAEAVFFREWLITTPEERPAPSASAGSAPYRPAPPGVLGVFPQPRAAR